MSAAHFDVIVIGAGHAGLEAALASARLGHRVLVLTINLENICLMPCNPSIGGSAKGHLVREIDALGGEMGRTIDRTLLQIRTLNRKKGPAIQALRAQADKILYQVEMKKVLEKELRIYLRQGVVSEILEHNCAAVGVKTLTGQTYHSKAVIVTTGTFLNGRCHIGQTILKAGRIGEPPSHHLAENLRSFGIKRSRLKTGTPPRILSSSIDYKELETQEGETPPPHFSFLTDSVSVKQVPCHLTQTTERTREMVLSNFHLSPLYSGQIKGVGPRYCPSIEDKFQKFPEKKSHLLYLEPESRFNQEVYLQGFSTSLPHDLQVRLVHTLPGLGNAKVLRPGYAVEYDSFNPVQLFPSLESKVLENLFFAGQINGTSGYEEAAGQGIVAGINCSRKLYGLAPIAIRRENSYIGVMIQDLVTRGTEEPYRMFSSLVEHRTYIRHDNADARLTPLSFEIGLASPERYKRLEEKRKSIEKLHACLKSNKVNHKALCDSPILTSSFSEKKSLSELLRRPEINLFSLRGIRDDLDNLLDDFPHNVRKEAEIEIKYEGYIRKQREVLKRREDLSALGIPSNFDYNTIPALSFEGREKLCKIRPVDVAQASIIAGVRQSDLALLVSYLRRENAV
ncbi:tRNA uridine-5-carboxymethylaminomethyl(34) synthesis enzyme MnmG [bacterium]|jgi:tRNA uridine 5-carboxymethylaminomethyl modification enzyme|nr:tRNA uridine-5-carboxymethylaminomethyl(34) synthesis enzyme MnmG [bacterium]